MIISVQQIELPNHIEYVPAAEQVVSGNVQCEQEEDVLGNVNYVVTCPVWLKPGESVAVVYRVEVEQGPTDEAKRLEAYVRAAGGEVRKA
jgi:hypothetical protein